MRVSRQSVQLVGFVVALGVIMSSCSSGQGSAEPSKTIPGTTVVDSVDVGSNGTDLATAEEGFMEMVEVRLDLEEPTTVDVLEVTSNDSELVLTFEMGSQQCYGVDASAEEVDGEVVLNVESGRLPDVAEPCVEGVYPYRVTVPLEAPLEGRSIRQAEPREPAREPTEEPAAEALATGKPDVVHLIGRPVEEGVQWAIENELEWHLASYDGVVVEPDGVDENRLSFEVRSDRIIGVSWA